MADQTSDHSTHRPRSSSETLEPVQDILTDDQISQEDDAPTQARSWIRSDTATYAAGISLLEDEVAEREDQAVFKKFTGNPQHPRFRDAVAQAGRDDISRVASAADANAAGDTNAAYTRINRSLQPFHIMHNWTQEEREGKAVAKIELMQPSAQTDDGHVVWLHVPDWTPSLARLQKYFNSTLSFRLPSDVRNSTLDLLTRVQRNRERRFARGKYLRTGPVRWDGSVTRMDDEDRPCTFLNFPYFAVGNFGSSSLDYGMHPTRSLLQTRYRLESTEKRDIHQAITSLTFGEVAPCIESSKHITTIFPNRRWKSIISVPQLWILSVTGDMMITSAPITENELRGPVLSTNSASDSINPKIVQFLVDTDAGHHDTFVYPTNLCECYFGLINKKRRILKTLGEKRQSQRPSTTRDHNQLYKLYSRDDTTGGQKLITSENWKLELRNRRVQAVEQLTVYMKRECTKKDRGDLPKFKLTTHTGGSMTALDLKVPQQHARERVRRHSMQGLSEPVVPAQSPNLLPVPRRGGTGSQKSGHSSAGSNASSYPFQISDPFLQWPFQEEKTARREYTLDDRLNVWLDRAIKIAYDRYQHQIDPDLIPPGTASAPDKEDEAIQGFEPIRGSSQIDVHAAVFGSSTPPERESNSVNITDHEFQTNTGVTALSAESANTLAVLVPVSNASDSHTNETKAARSTTNFVTEMESIFGRARRLLKLFVPEHQNSRTHNSVRLYWGLVGRILESVLQQRYSEEDLSILQETLDHLINDAEDIHKGVQKFDEIGEDGGVASPWVVKNVGSAVILYPVVQNLDHIIRFLFSTAIYAHTRRGPTDFDQQPFEHRVRSYERQIRENFAQAKRTLVAAADESTFEKSLGPVVTPEAIILLLIERLSRGVYNEGSINVIEIYERITERLAAKVETDANRHLLLEINRISEELTAVMDILTQQHQLLRDYDACLNPRSFDNASTKRWNRYPLEVKAIERIVKEVEEHIRDCRELQKRVSNLADQNIKIVESHQDDNNKTLMLFTVVTITFLPLSFFTSLWGMNLKGVVDTDYTVTHFWVIAAPITTVFVLLSVTLTYWNQTLRYYKKLSNFFKR